MYTILLLFTLIRFGFMAFVSERPQFILVGFVYSCTYNISIFSKLNIMYYFLMFCYKTENLFKCIIVIILILLYMVKRFYHDERTSSSTSDGNATPQSTSNDEDLEKQTV